MGRPVVKLAYTRKINESDMKATGKTKLLQRAHADLSTMLFMVIVTISAAGI